MFSDHLLTGQTRGTLNTQTSEIHRSKHKLPPVLPKTQLKLSPQYTGFISIFQNMPIRLIDINLNSLQALKPIMFLTQAFFYIHSSREKRRVLIFFSFFFSHLRQNTKEPLRLIFPTVYISICRPLLTASLQEKYPSFRVRYDGSYSVFGIFYEHCFPWLSHTKWNWKQLVCTVL